MHVVVCVWLVNDDFVICFGFKIDLVMCLSSFKYICLELVSDFYFKYKKLVYSMHFRMFLMLTR